LIKGEDIEPELVKKAKNPSNDNGDISKCSCNANDVYYSPHFTHSFRMTWACFNVRIVVIGDMFTVMAIILLLINEFQSNICAMNAKNC
jgi:hypothetical protein